MARKDRIPVVFDTNILAARLLSRGRLSYNRRIYDMWLIRRKLQLVISQPILDEYITTLEFLNISTHRISWLEKRLLTSGTVTRVNLGKRFYLSRDVKDNIFLDTSHVGRAKYLVTNDRDLLDIPKNDLRGLRFQIVIPKGLLLLLGE